MKKTRKSLLYIIPVVILSGVLIFALVKSLAIYVPQDKQQKEYENIKSSALGVFVIRKNGSVSQRRNRYELFKGLFYG
ncbi:MAG: hypothetical protein K6C14_02160 [Eubacterium sp.]|nr:hypothetical protein [Eubacterium sp.]